jgi:hypothetical protein
MAEAAGSLNGRETPQVPGDDQSAEARHRYQLACQTRDEALAQLIILNLHLDQARAERDAGLRQRDEAIGQLQAALRQRDEAIGQLQAALRQRDEAIGEANVLRIHRDEAYVQRLAAERGRDLAIVQLQQVLTQRDSAVTRAYSISCRNWNKPGPNATKRLAS